MGRIAITNQLILEQELRQNAIEREVIGFIIKHYPNRDWYVDAGDTTLEIRCASISMKYGMVVHLDKNKHELERRVVAASGELLERFGLSRTKLTTGIDETDLKRTIDGEVLGAAKGEYDGN